MLRSWISVRLVRRQASAVCCLVGAAFVAGGFRAAEAQTPRDDAIPVTDALVIAKCGQCHKSDTHGVMQYLSWERTTPEGWQDVLKRMILENNLNVTPAEARSIVGYLSAAHGLAPEEAKPIMYEAERRIHEETDFGDENLHRACAKCHSLARSLSWRRSADDWQQLASQHSTRFNVPLNDEAIAFLYKAAPLHTPAWDAWSAQAHAPKLAGRWLVTAYVKGRGKYYGEMQVEPDGASGEFRTRVTLTSVKDGSAITRTGVAVVYGGYAWRGRSKGSQPAGSAPDDLQTEMREAMWIAPDQSSAEGRWFWGQYQEFGLDVKLERPSSDPTVLAVDPPSLKTGSESNRIRLIADKIPDQITPAGLSFGPGVTVRRIVSRTANEVVAEVDVSATATPGWRDLALGRSVLSKAMAVYDRVDYVKVTPESALAAFGNQQRARGYQQFEAIAYHRGADGKMHTADDMELGPVDVTWSLEVFYALDGSSADYVGKISAAGFFTPAADSPQNNFDVWAIATAKNEKDKEGKPLVGKSYLVVTVPSYTFNGRRYVRDLDRWVDDGPASQ
jgi:quinohemoprotein amine dehydrogenase